jgi:hypothetical protein
MIHLWDPDSEFAKLDKYLHSNDTNVVAGVLLGIGIVSYGVKNDYDHVRATLPYSIHPLALLMQAFCCNNLLCFSRHMLLFLSIARVQHQLHESGESWVLALLMLGPGKTRSNQYIPL